MKKVTCICPTYGRAGRKQLLLEETIQSFLNQDFPVEERELLVFNDCPQQHLVFKHPSVIMINSHQRHKTLGGKYNTMVKISSGEYILPWEDDDISLPFRISQAVAVLDQGYDYFNPQYYWYINYKGELSHTHTMGIGHNCSAYRKSAWKDVGGYAPTTGDQDAVMDTALKAQTKVALPLNRNFTAWSYIYRWGVSDFHLSSTPGMQDAYDKYAHSGIKAGVFNLEPRWEKDYTQMCLDKGPR